VGGGGLFSIWSFCYKISRNIFSHLVKGVYSSLVARRR
jgi:hypothetical protein